MSYAMGDTWCEQMKEMRRERTNQGTAVDILSGSNIAANGAMFKVR